MKYKHIEVKGNEIKVNTPIPYTVVRKYPDESDQYAEDKEYKLENSCKFLYDVLRLLGISKVSAIKKGYTLNIQTGDDLLQVAREKGISKEMYNLISRYDW